MSGEVGPPTNAGTVTPKARLATAWLGGCSGCHMSFLDLDERLLELAQLADLVFSPIADVKEFPTDVDVTLVEGAVANEDHLAMIQLIRSRTKVLVALGDCAVTGNVTAIRNTIPLRSVLETAYVERTTHSPGVPNEPRIVPRLLERVEPLHRVVTVDRYLPGCPPSADQIWQTIVGLLSGEPAPEARPTAKFG